MDDRPAFDTFPPDRRPDGPEPGLRGVPRGLLWASGLAVIVLAIASWVALTNQTASRPARTGDGPSAADPAVGGPGALDITGQPAPALPAQRLGGGAPINVAALRGTPVVLNFWAPTCVPCLTEMPALERVHQRYGDRVRFVGVSIASGEDASRILAQQTGVHYDLGLDPTGQVATAFGVVQIPTTVFVGRDGTVLHVATRALSEAEMTALVEGRLLA
jgi:thiol-disulfide isomerase/thioredoxin